MNATAKVLLAVAVVFTAGAMVLWLATGRAGYTTYHVVERVEMEVEEDDPFGEAGFYDDDDEGNPVMRTVERDEFRLGLLPTPEGLFDKHLVSVATIAGPPWMAFIAVLLHGRLRGSPSPRDGRENDEP